MPMEIKPGTNQLDVQLSPVPIQYGSLWGLIENADTGNIIVGALIVIQGPGGTYQEESGSTGHYEIRDIVPGWYSVLVSAEGYEDYVI